MTMEDTLRLHTGDEVTWTDPHDGSVRVIRILQIEYLSSDAVRIMREDGVEFEARVDELS